MWVAPPVCEHSAGAVHATCGRTCPPIPHNHRAAYTALRWVIGQVQQPPPAAHGQPAVSERLLPLQHRVWQPVLCLRQLAKPCSCNLGVQAKHLSVVRCLSQQPRLNTHCMHQVSLELLEWWSLIGQQLWGQHVVWTLPHARNALQASKWNSQIWCSACRPHDRGVVTAACYVTDGSATAACYVCMPAGLHAGLQAGSVFVCHSGRDTGM